jgi:hypothetical protein
MAVLASPDVGVHWRALLKSMRLPQVIRCTSGNVQRSTIEFAGAEQRFANRKMTKQSMDHHKPLTMHADFDV